MTTKSTAEHTPGPWTTAPGNFIVTAWKGQPQPGHIVAEVPCQGANDADLAFIADAPETAAERDRLRAENATLLGALKRIADGQVVTGEFSHAEVIVAYQEIARDALTRQAKAEGRS